MRQRLLRYWAYIRRGHMYLAFVLSMANFIVIQYRLLVEEIPQLSDLFPGLWAWALLTTSVALPIMILIGWWDYKRGSYPIDATIMARQNPWVSDWVKAFIQYMNGDKEGAKKILEKWIKD